MICRDEAIVLKTRDFRETSKIAVFFSKKFGKINGLFKGIRSDPKKFASNLEFLSINEIIFYRKRFSDLHLVSQCDLKKNFDFVRSDIAKFSLLSFCAELLDSVMSQEDPYPEIYELLVNLLTTLEKDNFYRRLIYNFVVKLLSLSGFQPHLESCVICKDFIKNEAFFSNRFGGLLCSKCYLKDQESNNILQGTIASLLFLQNTPWKESLKLSILPNIEKQLGEIIFSFLNFHLDKKFKSLKIFDEVLDREGIMC